MRSIGVFLLALLLSAPAWAQPMDCGVVPDAAQHLLRTLAGRPDVAMLVRSASDDDRRVSARMFAEQMRFSFGPDWGSKASSPTNPQTKDAIAKRVGVRLCVWDIVNGATRELQFGHGEDITGQHFIAVTPIDHVGGQPPPPPGDLEKRVAGLELALSQLEDQIAAQVRDVTAFLERRVEALEAREPAENGVPIAEVNRLISAALAGLQVECSVGAGWLGHRHGCTAKVVR